MKKLMTISLALYSMSVLARTCPYVKDYEVVGLDPVEVIEIKMPDLHAKIWEKYHWELTKECQSIMTSTLSFMNDGSSYFTYLTNNDSCDGGNVYGFILDSQGKVLVDFRDGDPYCPFKE